MVGLPLVTALLSHWWPRLCPWYQLVMASTCCAVLQAKIIPESILQTCIKISNEPPSDMKSNMRRAFAAFTPEAEDRLSTMTKKNAYKGILFGLCFYHSLLLGRKKFGTGIGTGALRPVSAMLSTQGQFP